MSSNIAVSVRGLSKRYTLAHNAPKHTLASEALLHGLKTLGRKPDTEEFWALKDVSFDIHKGDVVGIIGRNGAGKSTLLKILSRITEPSSGQIDLYGRVGSLLEVGTGFHPELTGRENIFLNGAILGMSRREIASHFDAIVDFSGTEQFLDTPVKRYSSGMYVRLAFAVAAHLEPEILIVDEVLAVGDAEFQKKCLGKMQDVAAHGRTVLFVSHNVNAIEALCNRCVVMQKGSVQFDGTTNSALAFYRDAAKAIGIQEVPGKYDLSKRNNPVMPGRVFLRNLILRDAEGRITDTFYMAEKMSITIDLEGLSDYRNILVGVRLKSENDQIMFGFHTVMKPPRHMPPRGFREQYTLHIPPLPFMPGTYWLDLGVDQESIQQLDYVERAASLHIEQSDVYGSGHAMSTRDGVIYIDGEWTVTTDGEQSDIPLQPLENVTF